MTEGRLEAESRGQKSLGDTQGRGLRPKPTETPYAENGTYGVVGGRGLATPSYPIVYQDLDGKDKDAFHVWIRDSRGVVACLRVYDLEGVHIGRVATSFRRERLGSRIMAEGIRAAVERLGAEEILISAQKYAQPFYESCGFVRYTEPYLEDGIPHVGMRWKAVRA